MSMPKKIAVIILLAVAYFFLTQLLFSGVELPLKQKMYQQYASDNQDYFFNLLPKDVKIVLNPELADIQGNSLMGQTRCSENMSCTISLNPAENGNLRTIRFTLMHEECHIYVDKEGTQEEEHGPHWQGCMVSLATRGAFHDIW
jgi:SprT-like family